LFHFRLSIILSPEQIQNKENEKKMRVHLTQSYVSSLKHAPKKPIWITENEIKTLKLYAGTSGSKAWYLYYYGSDGKKAIKKIGEADKLMVAQARPLALSRKLRAVEVLAQNDDAIR
jgi:hypothetical protein